MTTSSKDFHDREGKLLGTLNSAAGHQELYSRDGTRLGHWNVSSEEWLGVPVEHGSDRTLSVV